MLLDCLHCYYRSEAPATLAACGLFFFFTVAFTNALMLEEIVNSPFIPVLGRHMYVCIMDQGTDVA